MLIGELTLAFSSCLAYLPVWGQYGPVLPGRLRERSKMRISVGILLALVMSLVATGATNAGIVNSGNVTIGSNSYRTFVDTTTSLTWLDLDNFWEDGSTYASLTTTLAGSGFHLATLSELTVLQSSIPAIPANFAAETLIAGGNYLGNPMPGVDRGLMWGIYEDGNSLDGVGYSWKYDFDTSWNTFINQTSSTAVLGGVNGSNRDLGAWVVSDAPLVAQTPEPASMALLAMGGSLLAFRRKLNRRRPTADLTA